jgi:hypothetical protein
MVGMTVGSFLGESPKDVCALDLHQCVPEALEYRIGRAFGAMR